MARKKSSSAVLGPRFVLLILRTLFTSLSVFVIIAVERKRGGRCIPEYETPHGDVGLPFSGGLPPRGEMLVTSFSPSEELNSVIRGRFDVRVGVFILIATTVFLPPMLEPCLQVASKTFRKRDSGRFQ